jgi:hypothetical protein
MQINDFAHVDRFRGDENWGVGKREWGKGKRVMVTFPP